MNIRGTGSKWFKFDRQKKMSAETMAIQREEESCWGWGGRG